MAFQCPKCQTPFKASDMNLGLKLANCSKCDHITQLTKESVKPAPTRKQAASGQVSSHNARAESPSEPPGKPEVLPLSVPGTRAVRHGSTLQITAQWTRWWTPLAVAVVMSLTVGYLVDAYMGGEIRQMIFGDPPSFRAARNRMSTLVLGSVILALEGYVSAAFLLNTSVISVRPNSISTQVSPIPWTGHEVIQIGQSPQIQVERVQYGVLKTKSTRPSIVVRQDSRVERIPLAAGTDDLNVIAQLIGSHIQTHK